MNEQAVKSNLIKIGALLFLLLAIIVYVFYLLIQTYKSQENGILRNNKKKVDTQVGERPSPQESREEKETGGEEERARETEA